VEPVSGYGLPDQYGHMRSAAADREHAIDILKTAFADGRLTKDEYEERIGLALGPLTYAELATLTADLPAGLPGSLSPPPHGYLPPPASRPLNKMAVASLVCAVLPGVPLLAILLGLIAHGQIQERGERGAGLATAGIMIGGLASLLFIVLVLQH
jgi:Domain of unknown function (DUF1707)/Domain of unknown function (DUF4190)